MTILSGDASGTKTTCKLYLWRCHHYVSVARLLWLERRRLPHVLVDNLIPGEGLLELIQLGPFPKLEAVHFILGLEDYFQSPSILVLLGGIGWDERRLGDIEVDGSD